MAVVVWITIGVALWHFTVFLPDRFRGGIVGAFLAASAGAMVSGAIAQVLLSRSIGETDLATVLFAVPGTIAALAIVYALGVRDERASGLSA